MNRMKVGVFGLLTCLLVAQSSLAAESAASLVQRGVDQIARGNYDQAVITFSKAVKSDPSDLQARRYLCTAMLKNGQAAAAAQQLEMITKFAPGNNSDMNLLAESYLHCGEWEKSAECFKKALRTDPTDATAKYGLCRTMLAVGDVSGARDLALHTIRSTSNQKIRTGCSQILSQIKERSLVQSAPVGNG
jgi:Flp pilus assembly protein TadD